MPVVPTGEILATAYRERYGVAAINIVNDLTLEAVLAAATEQSAPLIVQTSVKTVRSIGYDVLYGMWTTMTADVPVPVALHLDHCPDRAFITVAVENGWSSVLFDASDRDLATAERETAEVVGEAHAAGVDVESEIENIIGVEDGVGSDVSLHSYDVATLAAVAERTGVDLLAPQLGTAHGEYKAQPVLLPQRVRELAALTDRPIVLHGGTGLTADDFATFIAAGVSKINISTGVKVAYMRSAEKHLAEARARDRWDPPSMFRDISAAVQAAIAVHIEEFGAAGRGTA
jgi:fructose-bisphosphate aldolase class II